MRRVISILAIVTGIVVALGGVLLGVAAAIFSMAGNSDAGLALQDITLIASVIILGLGFGLSLLWIGRWALQDRPGRLLRLPGWGWFLVALLVTLGLGQTLAATALVSLLPLFHILAGVLSALLFLALVAHVARHQSAWVPARPVTGSLIWGGVGAPFIALFVELLAVIVIAALAILWLSTSDPQLISQLQAWAETQMRGGMPAPDASLLAELARHPAVIASALTLMGVVAPLVEELSKGLAIPLLALAGHRPTRLDGFVYGVAAGAGFTLLEGILNGSLALAAPQTWGTLMLARAGTAVIHCLASGLVGLGWQALISEQRWVRGLGLGLLAVVLHGVWNASAAGVVLAALQQQAGAVLGLPMMVQLMGLLLLGTLWVVSVGALVLLARTLARRQSAPIPPATVIPDSN